MIFERVKADRAHKKPRLKPQRGSWRRKLGWLLVVLCLVVLSAVSSRFYWHQQAYAYLHNQWTGDTAPGKNIWLPDYHVVIDGKVVESTLRNLSGITYDYDRDRLLAVTNNTPMEILALSKTGDVLERYPLVGFEDVEGITYMGNGRVAVSDEDLQQLDVLALPATVRPIHVEEADFIALGINLSRNNKGFEGLTYDAANDRLLAIKERDPRQLFEVSGVMKSIEGRLQIKINDLTSWVNRSVYGKDLSDVHFDRKTGHLLILSEESKAIIELDGDGKFVSLRSLRGGISDLKDDTPQAEGVTMDTSGNLYVVSEPNLFYLFQKK
jgi:uncharacterized protein YjiK